MKLFDTHIHLNDERFTTDIKEVVKRAQLAGVSHMINVGSDLKSSKLAVLQAKEYCHMYAAVGIHPHHADSCTIEALLEIEQLLNHRQVVAWGEIGLDYHYDFSPRDVQQQVFRHQLEIAANNRIPVIIHNRDSHQDMLQILSAWQGRVHGVMHCYSGSVEMAKHILDLDYFISIAGPVTFKNARRLIDVVQYVPLDCLLVETDCPYLAPVPHRGKRNEPAYVIEVAKKIAEIKGISLEQVIESTTNSAKRLFNTGNADA